MTDHIKVDESFVASILENASWDAAHLTLSEKKDSGAKKGDEGAGKDKEDKPDYTTDARKGDEGKGKDKDDKGDYTTDARKGDEGKGKKKKDKPDFTTDARKGDKSKTHAGKDFEGDEMKESVEEHTCPLCESVLEEALTDEQIQEHVAQITNALETIEEEDEALDEDADAAPKTSEKDAKSPAESPGYKSRDQQSVEYHEREAKRRETAMAKVKELKATAGGK
jgi:hypothetical protein